MWIKATYYGLLDGGAELSHTDVLVLSVGGDGHQEDVSGGTLGTRGSGKTWATITALKIDKTGVSRCASLLGEQREKRDVQQVP